MWFFSPESFGAGAVKGLMDIKGLMDTDKFGNLELIQDYPASLKVFKVIDFFPHLSSLNGV